MKRIVSLLALILTVVIIASLTLVQTAASVPSLTINFDSASDLTKYFSRPSGTTNTWKVSDGKLINDPPIVVVDGSDVAHQHLSGHDTEDWYWGSTYLTLKNQSLKDYEIEIALIYKETIDGDPLIDTDFWSVCTNVASGSAPASFTNSGYEWLNFQGTVKGPGVKQFLLFDLGAATNDYNYPWDYGTAAANTVTQIGATKKVSDWATGGTKTFKLVKSGTSFSYYYQGVQQQWNGSTYTDYLTPAGGSATLTNSAMDRAGAVQIKIGHNAYFAIESIKVSSPELNLDAYNTPTPGGTPNPNTGDPGSLALFGIALLSAATLAVGRRVRK